MVAGSQTRMEAKGLWNWWQRIRLVNILWAWVQHWALHFLFLSWYKVAESYCRKQMHLIPCLFDGKWILWKMISKKMDHFSMFGCIMKWVGNHVLVFAFVIENKLEKKNFELLPFFRWYSQKISMHIDNDFLFYGILLWYILSLSLSIYIYI